MLLHKVVIEIATVNPPPYADQVWSEDLLHKELNQAVTDMRRRIVTLLPPSWGVTTHGQLLPNIYGAEVKPPLDPEMITGLWQDKINKIMRETKGKFVVVRGDGGTTLITRKRRKRK